MASEREREREIQEKPLKLITNHYLALDIITQ